MLSLLYLSRSALESGHEERELQAILAVAVQRNLRSGITGALVKTDRDFAQVLEGPEATVAQVMGSILIDPRHEDVRILARQQMNSAASPIGAWLRSRAVRNCRQNRRDQGRARR
jgi:hypothetical protein